MFYPNNTVVTYLAALSEFLFPAILVWLILRKELFSLPVFAVMLLDHILRKITAKINKM